MMEWYQKSEEIQKMFGKDLTIPNPEKPRTSKNPSMQNAKRRSNFNLVLLVLVIVALVRANEMEAGIIAFLPLTLLRVKS